MRWLSVLALVLTACEELVPQVSPPKPDMRAPAHGMDMSTPPGEIDMHIPPSAPVDMHVPPDPVDMHVPPPPDLALPPVGMDMGREMGTDMSTGRDMGRDMSLDMAPSLDAAQDAGGVSHGDMGYPHQLWLEVDDDEKHVHLSPIMPNPF